MMLLALGAVAQDAPSMAMPSMSQEEHLAHLREFLAANSSHGPAIPQPESVGEAAVKNFTVTARSFQFTISPLPFTVNQGDVVNLTLTVPSGDASLVGHGILMETYIENGVDCDTGKSVPIQFTATTAGTFAFVCNIPDCGTGHNNMFGSMTVVKATNPAPTVTSISPTTGSVSGATVVTITGTGFLSGATVKFGGTAATNVSVASSTSITATTPAHALGKADVVVTNTDSQSGTLAQSYTYAAAGPTFSSVSPNTGPVTGGTPVTITGTGFQTGATVTFGSVLATNVTVVNATTITAFTPLGPASEQLAVDVVVTNADSTKATGTQAFTYTSVPPAVISITPNEALPSGAPGSGPISVTIFGAGFTTAVNSSVTVAGIAATNVQIVNPVTIHATFPAHAAGRGDVVVTMGGTSATLQNGFSWQNAPSKRRAVKH
jgi:hypothetical protein